LLCFANFLRNCASVTLTGTAAQIDAALASTSYLATNYCGTDSLLVTTAEPRAAWPILASAGRSKIHRA
jgi:hypothetical protein